MGKLLQILDGKDTHILKTNQDLYQALITLQLKSNELSIKQLKKETDYTGEIIEKVVLQNTNGTSKPIKITCTPESYALLQAIQSQQASLN
jgi:iron-sulfur cluster repair protein YtfE (RIC family)